LYFSLDLVKSQQERISKRKIMQHAENLPRNPHLKAGVKQLIFGKNTEEKSGCCVMQQPLRNLVFDFLEQVCGSGAAVQGDFVAGIAQILCTHLHLIAAECNRSGLVGATVSTV
jgi:hypothetical protein